MQYYQACSLRYPVEGDGHLILEKLKCWCDIKCSGSGAVWCGGSKWSLLSEHSYEDAGPDSLLPDTFCYLHLSKATAKWVSNAAILIPKAFYTYFAQI